MFPIIIAALEAVKVVVGEQETGQPYAKPGTVNCNWQHQFKCHQCQSTVKIQ